MKATTIFLPALALMLWTLLVLLQVPIRRFGAYFAGSPFLRRAIS
jgi:hypothetical protein